MSKSLITKFAERFGVDDDKLLSSLKSTAFKQKDKKNSQGKYEPVVITNEQMIALLVVADQYKLNPWTKEIYAYPDKGGIIPIVGVDGWSRIINENPEFNGMEFKESENVIKHADHKNCPEWIECTIHRKDRQYPISVKEYFDETYRPPFTGINNTTKKEYKIDGPWQTHTKRMLRHKAMIQCARIAFAYTGIHDQDEAERIIEAEVIREPEYKSPRIEQGTKDLFASQVIEALANADDLAVKELYSEWSNDEILVLNGLFNPTERTAIKLALKTKEPTDGQS